MNEIHRIVDQLQRAHDGDPWYGNPLMTILDGVTAKVAADRSRSAHSIWELLAHITVWQQESARRLRDRNYRKLSYEEDWPTVTDTSEKAWKNAVQSLVAAHRDLVATLHQCDPALLDQTVPGSPNQTYYLVLHGVIQHSIYHTAQIALLKKQAAQ
jgi:uncharacterized damage-inducible protein DinB